MTGRTPSLRQTLTWKSPLWISPGTNLDERGRDIGAREVIVPDEAEAVRELYRQLLTGESLRNMAKYLNDKGFVTGRGNPSPRTSSTATAGTLAGFDVAGDALAGSGTVSAVAGPPKNCY